KRLLEAGVERPAALLRRRLRDLWQRNDELDLRARERIVGLLRRAESRLRDRQHRLAELDLRVQLTRRRLRLEGLRQRLAPAVTQRLERTGRRLEVLDRELRSLSPVAILERGYAIVTTQEGAVVHDAGRVGVGDELAVRLHRGRLDVRVENTERA